MSLFPTKFVCDVGTATFASADTVEATLTVGGVVILSEKYSPANGQITVRGLRSVLEAAIYGDLNDISHASAAVTFVAGSYSESSTLYAARLKNPRDPNGSKNVLVAGDIVAVAAPNGSFITPAVYATTSGLTSTAAANGTVLGDSVRLWVDHTSCPERCVAVRFLNRYDVPQTMMTICPLEIKPGFADQTALMDGRRVRYTVDQQDEYILRSGRIHSMEEYASWADLVSSRKAQVLYCGQWQDIVVTKSNFNIKRQPVGMPRMEISFRMADPRQGM